MRDRRALGNLPREAPQAWTKRSPWLCFAGCSDLHLLDMLTPTERKRQGYIHELIVTEENYVNDLQLVTEVRAAGGAGRGMGSLSRRWGPASQAEKLSGVWEPLDGMSRKRRCPERRGFLLIHGQLGVLSTERAEVPQARDRQAREEAWSRTHSSEVGVGARRPGAGLTAARWASGLHSENLPPTTRRHRAPPPGPWQ